MTKYTREERDEITRICRGNKSREMTQLDLFMKHDSPTMEYRPTRDIRYISKHNSKRKRFISDLYFLTTYGDLSQNVLYIANDNCGHLFNLNALFPNHRFYVWGSDEYDTRIIGLNNKQLHLSPVSNDTGGFCVHPTTELNELAEHYSQLFRGNYLLISARKNVETLVKNTHPQAYAITADAATTLRGFHMWQIYAPYATQTTWLLGTLGDIIKGPQIPDQNYVNKLHYHNLLMRQWARCQKHSWDHCAELLVVTLYCDQYDEPVESLMRRIAGSFPHAVA
ncbi:hypothetical protein KDA11_05675 [Candidatus Saccharibacteria bacterium]|nr:hypothetical protein [Candidatus Saccharibacteria bacterium]